MQTRFDRFCGAGHGLCRRWGPASADPTDSTSGEGLFGRSHCEATAGRRKQLTAAVFEQTGHDLGCSNMVNLETVQANSVFFPCGRVCWGMLAKSNYFPAESW